MYSELQRVTTRYYKISTGKPQVVKLLIVKKKKKCIYIKDHVENTQNWHCLCAILLSHKINL